MVLIITEREETTVLIITEREDVIYRERGYYRHPPRL